MLQLLRLAVAVTKLTQNHKTTFVCFNCVMTLYSFVIYSIKDEYIRLMI